MSCETGPKSWRNSAGACGLAERNDSD